MRIYVVKVVYYNPYGTKISQEGFYTLEAAQDWCRKKPGVEELDNGWRFIAEDCEYWVHDILVR